MKISVIIPTYNEEKSIKDCLDSLNEQTFKEYEILVIDDGSTDKTVEIINSFLDAQHSLKLLQQKHLGPGIARNLGAENAKGEILVFVDSDMTFEKDFLEKLTKPIIDGKAIGTFSKEEKVLNKDNFWSKCWNLNKGLPIDRMHPKDYPDTQSVFRAILKREFKKTKGFQPIGYIDDYTISEQLGEKAVNAPGAVFYHRNPESLSEIWTQARWVGKSEFKNRKIKNEGLMKTVTLIRYSLPFSFINGIIKAIKFSLPGFIMFKIIYDLAIEVSVIGSYLGEQKYK